MSKQEMRKRISKHCGTSEELAGVAIKIVLDAFGCIMVPPHPPSCPVGPRAIVKKLSDELKVSEEAAGTVLALIVSEITVIARNNGIESVLEFVSEKAGKFEETDR